MRDKRTPKDVCGEAIHMYVGAHIYLQEPGAEPGNRLLIFNNHRSSGFRSIIDRLLHARVLFRMVRNCRTTLDNVIFNLFYLLHSYNPSFLICLCFNMVSFRGQKKLGPRPDRSPLGV